MVSDISFQTALDQQSKTQAAQTGLAEDFSQFLTLLTTQLQNQDPLNPMDSTEFTNQLVAFTGVEQQINTNQKLDSLVSLQLGNSYSSALSYVGKDVNYLSSEFNYDGNPSTFTYALDSVAAESKLRIYDEDGVVVYETDASKNTGQQSFTWDGKKTDGTKAPAGTYEVKIDAVDASGEAVESTTVVSGNVRGVETQNGSIYLLVGDRAVSVGNVLNATAPTDYTNNASNVTAALSYIGMDITYPSTQISYDGQALTAPIAYTLPEAAERAKIYIFDEDGNQVLVADAPTAKGNRSYLWDGKDSTGTRVAAGNYQFAIDAINADDERIETTSTGSATVAGIETKNGEIYLNTSTGETIKLSNILSVREHAEDGA
jgi:flagellar basal-body rod modification protein FlgD